MKYGIYIKCPDERKELQVIVDEDDVKSAIDMLETYYDFYSYYELFSEEIEVPKYLNINDLESKYKKLGQ